MPNKGITKRSKEVENSYDKKLIEELEVLIIARTKLQKSVTEATTKTQIVNIYPQSAKDQAEKRAEEAREKMFAALKEYDTAREAYAKTLESTKDLRSSTKGYADTFVDGERLVEMFFNW